MNYISYCSTWIPNYFCSDNFLVESNCVDIILYCQHHNHASCIKRSVFCFRRFYYFSICLHFNLINQLFVKLYFRLHTYSIIFCCLCICVFMLVMLFFWKTFADTHDQYVLLFLSCYNFENIHFKFLFIYLWTILLIAQHEP